MPDITTPTFRRLAAVTALTVLGVGLVGCATSADPVVARESLEHVTEDPSVPDAAAEYSVETHPDPIVEPLDDCAPVLVITARGTGEPSKGQLVAGLARGLVKAEPDKTERLDLDYPADTEVKEGGTQGVRTLIDTLNVQAENCADQEFVLLGYSQGALVIGDALSSPDVRLIGETVGEVSPAAAERIEAIAFYGDPRFVGTEPFNEGDFDADFGGLLPRPAGALEAYADRIVDFCVANDFVCQSGLVLREGLNEDGSLDEKGHVAYFKNGMRTKGLEFILDKLGWEKAEPTPTPTEDAANPASGADKESGANDDSAAAENPDTQETP